MTAPFNGKVHTAGAGDTGRPSRASPAGKEPREAGAPGPRSPGSDLRAAGHRLPAPAAHLSSARKAAGSTSGSSISADVVAMPPLNMASKTALPAARTKRWAGMRCGPPAAAAPRPLPSTKRTSLSSSELKRKAKRSFSDALVACQLYSGSRCRGSSGPRADGEGAGGGGGGGGAGGPSSASAPAAGSPAAADPSEAILPLRGSGSLSGQRARRRHRPAAPSPAPPPCLPGKALPAARPRPPAGRRCRGGRRAPAGGRRRWGRAPACSLAGRRPPLVTTGGPLFRGVPSASSSLLRREDAAPVLLVEELEVEGPRGHGKAICGGETP